MRVTSPAVVSDLSAYNGCPSQVSLASKKSPAQGFTTYVLVAILLAVVAAMLSGFKLN